MIRTARSPLPSLTVLSALLPTAAVAAPLLAGVGKRSITPPADVGHVALGGYGERQGATYQGVHDEIYARALALKSGETICVIVALDRLEVPQFLHDDICAALATENVSPSVEGKNLVITASHTHSAPENLARHGDLFPLAFGKYNDDLYRWTLVQIVDAIGEAVSSLQPARLGSAQVRLDGLVANRRGDEVTDPVLTVLWIVAENGVPVAALANFAAHPTMLGAENLLVSGEWPGAAERIVEETLGNGAVCLFTNGALGDQRPAGDFGSGFERVKRYGQRLADEILATRDRAALTEEPALSVAGSEVTLPPKQPSPAFIESAREEYPVPPEMMTQVLNALFPQKGRLQVVRLGEAAIITVPGEMVAALGIELKQEAARRGLSHPFVAGLSNTYCGYILTPEGYDEGGYEAAVSVYGRSFGPWLLRELAGLIEEVAR